MTGSLVNNELGVLMA